MAELPIKLEALPREQVSSYKDYVGALTSRLELSQKPERLYEKSAMDLPAWLDALRIDKDASPVDVSLRIGPDTIKKTGTRTIELHSDDNLPQKIDDLLHGSKRLEAYALAEAKLQYLAKHHEDLPALRGFELQTRLYDIRSQAKFYQENGYWKEYAPIGKKIRQTTLTTALGLVLASCGVQVGTGPISTEAPPATQTPIVEPGPTGVPVTREMASGALAKWIGATRPDGFKLPDANGDGVVDSFTVLPGQISMVDTLTNQETGRSALVATPSGANEYDLFLVWNNAQGAQAYRLEGYRANLAQGTTDVDLFTATGEKFTTMSVNMKGSVEDPWATFSVEDQLGNTSIKKLIELKPMGAPQEQQEFFTHLASFKVRSLDVPLTPTPDTGTPTAEATHTIEEYTAVLTTYDTESWPEWAKQLVTNQGKEAAITQLAVEQLKAAGVVVEPETMTPTEFFDAYVNLNEGKIGYMPEEWRLADFNNKENYMVMVHAVNTPDGIVGQGWNLGGGETPEMRQAFASEVNTNFNTPDGKQLVIRPFFFPASVLGEGVFGVFQKDTPREKSIMLVIKMENNGQTNYAHLQVNFEDYITTPQDVCLQLGGGSIYKNVSLVLILV